MHVYTRNYGLCDYLAGLGGMCMVVDMALLCKSEREEECAQERGQDTVGSRLLQTGEQEQRTRAYF